MPKQMVSVRILRNTRVAGEPVPAVIEDKQGNKRQNVVRCLIDDARAIVAGNKGEIVDQPDPENEQEPAKEPAPRGSKK